MFFGRGIPAAESVRDGENCRYVFAVEYRLMKVNIHQSPPNDRSGNVNICRTNTFHSSEAAIVIPRPSLERQAGTEKRYSVI